LDVALVGLVASELYVLGARTSADKTTQLLQIAHYVTILHRAGAVRVAGNETGAPVRWHAGGKANISVNQLALCTLHSDERQRALS